KGTLVRTVDQLDLDGGRCRHGEDWIACPVARADPAAVEAHLFLQGPAHRLDDAAFDLIGKSIRIDDQPSIDRGGHARHAHRAAAAIDFELRHNRYVGREVLVFGKTEATAARAVTFPPFFPASFLGNRLDDRPGARVAEMREAEGNRIDAGRGCELIHEAFDGEYVGIAAERA